MADIQGVAKAFKAGKTAQCHNARTDGQAYYLHGHKIAEKIAPGILRTQWCGWVTPTTQNHLQTILEAFGIFARLRRADADTQDWTIEA